MPTRFIAAPLALVALAVAAAVAAAPARAQSSAGAAIDGIRCDSMEGSVFHIHQHVTILDHGRSIAIPDDVGRPDTAQCLYWIHTHSGDGLIHIESPVIRSFTLGNFFDVWGQPLSATHVGPAVIKKGQLHVFVGGNAYHGDPRAVDMTLHADIVLEAGPPYSKPTPFTNWQGQ